MTKKHKLQDICFRLGLLALFAFFYVTASPFTLETKQFPQLIAICTMVVIILSLMADLKGKASAASEKTPKDHEKREVNDATTDGTSTRRFYEAWAIILVSTAIGFLGGFLFMVFLLFLGFGLRSVGRKKVLKTIIIAVLSTATIYYLFQSVVGIPLLDGILW